MSLEINMNPRILAMDYAVRGPILDKALELEKEGKEVVKCNIGNPLAFYDNKPLTYIDDFLALIQSNRLYDFVLGCNDLKIPQDIIQTVKYLRELSPAGTRAYSHSKGVEFVRKGLADYINRRDVFVGDLASNADNIYLTDGASKGIEAVMKIIISSSNDGVMTPIPQYPLYSALIEQLGAKRVDYFPDEEKDWSVDSQELERSYGQAVSKGIKPKILVDINPNNPTGALKSRKSMETMLDFAEDKNMIILADEVYQDNIFNGEFNSYAKVRGSRDVPVFSFHSASKGFYGLCGLRGGYVELRADIVDKITGVDMNSALLKLQSTSLCSNVTGQYAMFLVTNPPSEGTESYEQYISEMNNFRNDLLKKDAIARKGYESMKNITEPTPLNALYHFVNLGQLPDGKTDSDYAMDLVNKTGLVVVPGTGFGQKSGTNHVRLALLPGVKQLERVFDKWIDFHNSYV